jgi:hypothetical protein
MRSDALTVRWAHHHDNDKDVETKLGIIHSPNSDYPYRRATPVSYGLPTTTRRDFWGKSCVATGAATISGLMHPPPPAHARGGLVQFPCTGPLGNTYYFLRVGQTLLEQEDIWCTNPLFLTNQDAALSETGIRQVREACQQLKRDAVIPSIVRYSFAAACLDTAAILGEELQITQDRLIPEFFFLDPRAIGQWDKLPLSTTEPAMWALDKDQAQKDGSVRMVNVFCVYLSMIHGFSLHQWFYYTGW